MKLTKEDIQKGFADVFAFDSKEGRIEHHATMLMFRFLSEIGRYMEEHGLSKKQLAEEIGTSASYVTQLFRGDKLINIPTLAKIEVAFNKVFDVSLREEAAKHHDVLVDVDEDALVRYLNERVAGQGCWVYRRFPDLTTSDDDYIVASSNAV